MGQQDNRTTGEWDNGKEEDNPIMGQWGKWDDKGTIQWDSRTTEQ